MTDLDSTQSDLGTAIEAEFAILSNETRMGILLVLWRAYDPLEGSSTVRFSELYDAVEIDDTGQFNYHLDQLRDRFVTQTDAGYELNAVGLRIVQSIVAGAGQQVEFGPEPVDETCRNCGGDIELQYQNGRLFLVCQSCAGNFDEDRYPVGAVRGQSLPPAGLRNRTPEELISVLSYREGPRQMLSTGGICPECSAELHRTMDVCPDHHEPKDGPCPTCGFSVAVRVRGYCTVCKYHTTGTPSGFLNNHPAILGFHWEHGLAGDYPYARADFDALQSIREEMAAVETQLEVVAHDPTRIEYAVEYEDEWVALTVDEHMEVIEVDQSA